MVPIRVVFSKDGKQTHAGMITCFALSINERWFLLTAGHCLDVIRENEKDGHKVSSCYLMDFLGTSVIDHQPIPFDWEQLYPIRIGEGDDLDYGVLAIETLTTKLLKSNGIVPLNEEVWECQADVYDFHALLGVPYQLTKDGDDGVQFRPTLLRLQELDEKPAEFAERDDTNFYGHIVQLPDDLTDIGGMSGGPIFGFKQTEQGVKYWLVALQSSWFKSTRNIVGCPVYGLAKYLRDVMEKLVSEDEVSKITN